MWRWVHAAEMDAVAGDGEPRYKDRFEDVLINVTSEYYASEGSRLVGDLTLADYARYVSV